MENSNEEEIDQSGPITISKIPFSLQTSRDHTKEIFRFSQLGKFIFTKKFLLLFFSFSISIPLVSVYFFSGFSSLTLLLFCFSFLITIACYFILKRWEEALKGSVSALVKAKMEQIKQLHDPNLEEKITEYQKTIEMLENVLKEARRGYEHQIDLLQTSIAKSKAEVDELNFQMDKKMNEAHQIYLRYEDLKQQCAAYENEIVSLKKETEEQINSKESLIKEYQQTISEQRVVIEKKQRFISKLESKVRDLTYEIRSLLQLEQAAGATEIKEFSPMVSATSTPVCAYNFNSQLQKYLTMAQSITGVDHLGYIGGKSPRFLDMSLNNYALDFRRLCDFYRDEMGAVIFIWSTIEKKVLFCNNYVKTVLGISPEKFIKDFFALVQMGQQQLEETLSHLKTEAFLKLGFRLKSGELSIFECSLGVVREGPFASYIIGILSISS